MGSPVPLSSLNPKGATVSDPSSYQPPPPPPPQYQAPPPPPPQYQAPAPAGSGLSDNAASALAYVTFIPAIIFLVVPPYNQSPNVRFHSWQSILLTVASVVIDIVLAIVLSIALFFLPYFLHNLIWRLIELGWFVVWLACVYNAFNGKRLVLPIIGPIAAKQAGA
jgi:uncharacterized membrane protein